MPHDLTRRISRYITVSAASPSSLGDLRFESSIERQVRHITSGDNHHSLDEGLKNDAEGYDSIKVRDPDKTTDEGTSARPCRAVDSAVFLGSFFNLQTIPGVKSMNSNCAATSSHIDGPGADLNESLSAERTEAEGIVLSIWIDFLESRSIPGSLVGRQ